MIARAVLEQNGATVVARLHVARGARERTRGLLGRDALPDGEGMWFPACRLIHTFGMKFPIDLVYLNRRLEICKIVAGMQPGRLSACLGAESVIELTSGAAKKLGLSRGIRLKIVEQPSSHRSAAETALS